MPTGERRFDPHREPDRPAADDHDVALHDSRARQCATVPRASAPASVHASTLSGGRSSSASQRRRVSPRRILSGRRAGKRARCQDDDVRGKKTRRAEDGVLAALGERAIGVGAALDEHDELLAVRAAPAATKPPRHNRCARPAPRRAPARSRAARGSMPRRITTSFSRPVRKSSPPWRKPRSPVVSQPSSIACAVCSGRWR